MAEPGEPFEPGVLALWHEQARGEPRQDAGVVLEALVVGAVGHPRVDPLVGVPEERRGHPRPAGEQGHVVVPVVERRTIADDPVVGLVHPGVERRSTRRARSGLGEVTGEVHATSTEPIKGGRGHQRVLDHVGAELVEGDEQDVHGRASSIIERIDAPNRWMASRTPVESPAIRR